MEFLLFWTFSIITSYCMEISLAIRFIKDLADEGYKINEKNIENIFEKINSNVSNTLFLTRIMPFYNMLKSFESAMKYNDIKLLIFNELNTMGAIVEMDKIEKEEYLKKPTSMSALFLNYKVEKRLEKASVISICDNIVSLEIENILIETEFDFENTNKSNNKNGTIYYEVDNEKDEIIILKTEGEIQYLKKEEQKQIIINLWINLEEYAIEKYGNIDTFFIELFNNYYNQEIKKDNDKIDTKNEERKEKINYLNNWKEELLNKKENKEDANKNKSSFVRKRK